MLKAPSMLNRLVVVAVLGAAFLVMASVFSPQRTKAGDAHSSGGAAVSSSSDPHIGLRSLGTIDSSACIVHIYATAEGPRYSIYAKASGDELATLLTAEQATQLMPDLQLETSDFSASDALMLAEPVAPDGY